MLKNNAKGIILALAALGALFIASEVSASHPIKAWRWEIQDNGDWVVRWNSLFRENETRYDMFPTDTRRRIRAAYQEWSGLPNSLLTFNEVTSRSGSTDHETHPLNFNVMPSWGDVAGYSTKRMNSRNEVLSAASWLNTNWDWTENRMDWSTAKADVQTVQVHEIGHPTGFGHPRGGCLPTNSDPTPRCSRSTVMGWIWRGIKRNLTTHDKQIMADRY